MKPQTQDQKTLATYAKQLTKLQTVIERNELLVITSGKLALSYAIKAGGLLIECKKLLEHGLWGKWLKDNVSTISHTTACKYMGLTEWSKLNPDLILKCDGPKEAYMASGIIKPTTKEPEIPPVVEPEEKEPETKKPDNAQDIEKIKQTSNALVSNMTMTLLGDFPSFNHNMSEWTITDKQLHYGEYEDHNASCEYMNKVVANVMKHEYQDLSATVEMKLKLQVMLHRMFGQLYIYNQLGPNAFEKYKDESINEWRKKCGIDLPVVAIEV